MAKTNTHALPSGYKHYKPNKTDREKVKRLILLGSTDAQIAASLDIAKQTLWVHYGSLLKTYHDERLALIANKANTLALRGNTRMIEFVLKTRSPNWRTSSDLNIRKEVIKRVIGVADEDV